MQGLRNALKKSRTHRRSQESLELQPLHTPSNNNAKGTLKRMSRVKSHDLSQEENDKKDNIVEPSIVVQQSAPQQPTTSPLGAGLPLLQRLRLLKEKQDNEERAKISSPIVSPSSSSIKSPPPIVEEPNEPIGVGLPLLQRILMLKAKEEKAAKAKVSVKSSQLSHKNCSSQPTSPTPVATTRASFSTPKIPAAKLVNNKISFR